MAEIGIQITAQNAAQNAFQQLQRDIQRSNEHLERIAENTQRVRQNTERLTGAQRVIRDLSNEYRRLRFDLDNVVQVSNQFARVAARQARSAIDSAVEFERLRISLDVISESAEEAAAQYERLIEVSRLPGLNLQQAIRASVQLQAIGQSGESAANSITQFGNALALGGGSARDLGQITNAIRQMSAEGSILQEDLSILTTRLAVIVPILREEFNGVRAEDIRRYFDAMNVAQSDQAAAFLNIITQRLQELPRAGDTAANALENLGDTIERTQATVASQYIPAIRAATATTEQLLMSIEEADATTVASIANVAAFGASFLTTTAAASGLVRILPRLRAAAAFLSGATGPVGLAITAVGLLAAGLVSWRLEAARAAESERELQSAIEGKDFNLYAENRREYIESLKEQREELEALIELERTDTAATGRERAQRAASITQRRGALAEAGAALAADSPESQAASQAILEAIAVTPEQRERLNRPRNLIVGEDVSAIIGVGHSYIQTAEAAQAAAEGVRALGFTFEDTEGLVRDATASVEDFVEGINLIPELGFDAIDTPFQPIDSSQITEAGQQIRELLASIRDPNATAGELVGLEEQLEAVFDHLDSLGIVVPNLAQIRSEVSGIVGEATDDQLSGLAETTLRNQERTFAEARRARDEHNQREEQTAQNAIDGLNRQQESARRRRQRDENADRREREQAAREHQRRLQRIAAESADIIANTFQLDTSPLFDTLSIGLEVAIRQGVEVLPDAFARQLDALLPIIGPFFADFFGGLFESLNTPDLTVPEHLRTGAISEAELFGGQFGQLRGASPGEFTTAIGDPGAISLDGLTVDFSPLLERLPREPITKDDFIDIYNSLGIPHNLERTAENTGQTSDNTIDISRLSSILQASQTDLRGVIELLQREPETSPLQDFIDNRQGILRIFGNDEFRGLVSEFVVANTEAAERQQELLQEQQLQQQDPEAFELLQNLETLLNNVPVDPSLFPPSGIEGLLDESGIFESFDGLIDRIREALLFPLSPEARADLLSDLETVFSVLPILPETATSFLEQLAVQLSETELQVDPNATVEAVLSQPQLQAIIEATGEGVPDLGAGGLQDIFDQAGLFDLGAASLIEQLNNAQASLNEAAAAQTTPVDDTSDVFRDISQREADLLAEIDAIQGIIADSTLGLQTQNELDRQGYQDTIDHLQERLAIEQASLEAIRRSRDELELFFGIVSDATTAVESFAIGAEAAGASPFASLTGIVDEFQRLLGLSDTGQDFTALTTHIRNALTGPQLSVDTFESFRGAAGRAFDEAGLTTSDNAVIAEQARLFLENLSGIDINPESLNQLAMMYPDTVGIDGVVTTAPEGGAMTVNPEGGSLTVNPEGDSMNVTGLMAILGIPTVNVASLPPLNINVQTFGSATDDSTQDQLIHQTGGTLSAG